MDEKREFTGVWIPKHIIDDKSLKPAARLIYAEIACFRVCTMSNKTLGERAGCSESTAQRYVQELKNKKYIQIFSFDGRIRKMRSLYDKYDESPQNNEADSAKCIGQTPQNDDKDNNIENKKNTTIQSSSKELDVAHLWICTLFSKNTNKYKLTTKRKQKLRLRLKELGNQGIKDAYNNIFMSNFHRGDNDRGWKIDDDPYWLLENAERAEKWANKETVETIDGIPTNIDLSKAGVR